VRRALLTGNRRHLNRDLIVLVKVETGSGAWGRRRRSRRLAFTLSASSRARSVASLASTEISTAIIAVARKRIRVLAVRF